MEDGGLDDSKGKSGEEDLAIEWNEVGREHEEDGESMLEW